MTTKASNDKVEWDWVWAYREQLRLLDGFDSQGLRCAEFEWDEDSWRSFRNEYALRQGHQAEFGIKREDVIQEVKPIFKVTLSQNSATNSLHDIWHEGVARIGRLAKKKRKDKSDPKLWSMTSKLLWFYHPIEMTMYDRYAAAALKAELGYRITPYNYLQAFEQLLKEKRPSIDAAATLSDRQYPYPRRVLDKWLWLSGSGQKEERLRRFSWSLERAPIRSTRDT